MSVMEVLPLPLFIIFIFLLLFCPMSDQINHSRVVWEEFVQPSEKPVMTPASRCRKEPLSFL